MMMGTALRALAHPTDLLQRLGSHTAGYAGVVSALRAPWIFNRLHPLATTAGEQCGLITIFRHLGEHFLPACRMGKGAQRRAHQDSAA